MGRKVPPMKKLSALAVLVVVTLAGCGGDDAETVDTTVARVDTSAAVVASDATTAETQADDSIAGVSAKLQNAGIDCTLELAPAEEDTIDAGVKVDQTEYDCTVGALGISYNLYGSSDDYESAMAQMEMYKPMMHGFGILEFLFVDGGKKAHWSAGVGNADESDSPRPTDAQRTLAGKVADALGGKLVTVETS